MAGSRKLGRTSDHRKAMLRAMVTFLLENGKIETTVTRAKEVRAMAEKMITLGKAGDLHSKRQVLSYVTKEGVVEEAVRRNRPQICGPERRLHQDREDRAPPRRRRRDGDYRARLIILQVFLPPAFAGGLFCRKTSFSAGDIGTACLPSVDTCPDQGIFSAVHAAGKNVI